MTEKAEYLRFLTVIRRSLQSDAIAETVIYVMYNSAPLFLADKAEEIRKLMPAQTRLDFTVENKEQVREICKIYMNAFTEGKKMEPQIREYTRGHFKRGVK